MGGGALRLSREGWTGSLGLADENCYIQRMDKQQDPTVQQRELRSISYNKPYWKKNEKMYRTIIFGGGLHTLEFSLVKNFPGLTNHQFFPTSPIRKRFDQEGQRHRASVHTDLGLSQSSECCCLSTSPPAPRPPDSHTGEMESSTWSCPSNQGKAQRFVSPRQFSFSATRRQFKDLSLCLSDTFWVNKMASVSKDMDLAVDT